MHVPQIIAQPYNDLALQFGEWRGVPSVQPRNMEAISEKYDGHTPNERIVRLGQAGSSLILSPQVIISDETTDEILEHTSSGGVLLLLFNHFKLIDPLILSAVMQQEPAFEAVRHNIIIPAKTIIFRIPGIRYLADGMGAFPVLRDKDVSEKDGTVSKENKAAQLASGKFTINLMVNHLVGKNGDAGSDEDAGDEQKAENLEGEEKKPGSAALLAEGERNKGNPLIVQDFKGGAVHIYQKARRKGAKVAIMTGGVVYDAGSMSRATVHIGGLIEPKGKKLHEKSEDLRNAVQRSVSEAHRVGYRNK
ncbi:MAG: 1-acyl-sn-glycerol-3-phosphate acyltransferase [Candidatus Saccharibacteria bacterium]|nr:1-acyl-sn-glycerol-3-phosphate acyltransferase [Candidatus Saccharibacteria bacterium]